MNSISARPRTLIVINPISGDMDKDHILDEIIGHLNNDQLFEVYRTCGNKDVEIIKETILRFRPSRIIVVGGDGTIKLIVEALNGQKLPIGIIPAGSANGLATNLSIPEDQSAAIKIAFGNKTRLIDNLLIEGDLGLHISDMGINAELVEKYCKSRIRGHFGYAINTIPALINSDIPYRFTLDINGGQREVTCVMLAFANSRKFGTGALVNPNGSIDDGMFEVLIFKNLDPIGIFRTLIHSENLDSDFVESIRVTSVRVRSDIPISLQIDGEPCGKKREVNIEIIPQNMEIFVQG
ncbi:MAG: diacylglycerol kinase family protein [Leeuwenhoekiella sp.]